MVQVAAGSTYDPSIVPVKNHITDHTTLFVFLTVIRQHYKSIFYVPKDLV
jgi:hypothetical protein